MARPSRFERRDRGPRRRQRRAVRARARRGRPGSARPRRGDRQERRSTPTGARWIASRSALRVGSTRGPTPRATAPRAARSARRARRHRGRSSTPVTLAAHAGATARPPSFVELYGDRGAFLGDPILLPESAWTVDAGARTSRRSGPARFAPRDRRLRNVGAGSHHVRAHRRLRAREGDEHRAGAPRRRRGGRCAPPPVRSSCARRTPGWRPKTTPRARPPSGAARARRCRAARRTISWRTRSGRLGPASASRRRGRGERDGRGPRGQHPRPAARARSVGARGWTSPAACASRSTCATFRRPDRDLRGRARSRARAHRRLLRVPAARPDPPRAA